MPVMRVGATGQAGWWPRVSGRLRDVAGGEKLLSCWLSHWRDDAGARLRRRERGQVRLRGRCRFGPGGHGGAIFAVTRAVRSVRRVPTTARHGGYIGIRRQLEPARGTLDDRDRPHWLLAYPLRAPGQSVRTRWPEGWRV